MVARSGAAPTANRCPAGCCAMANDRLAGTYILPDADGSRSRVREGTATHAPIAIADMYVFSTSLMKGIKVTKRQNHRVICRSNHILGMRLTSLRCVQEDRRRLSNY